MTTTRGAARSRAYGSSAARRSGIGITLNTTHGQTAWQIGKWSAAVLTAFGVCYAGVLIAVAATGHLALPPSEPVQTFAAVVTLVDAPLLILLVASVHSVTPEPGRVLSRAALAFTVLFAAAVSVNRFVQLAIVRPAMRRGETAGLARLLPYDTGSAMFALEILGWGWFLGLAALALAPLFGIGRLERAIRWSLVVYGVLGIASAIGYIVGSAVSAVGFVAWGLALYVTTGLLTIFFRHARRASPRPNTCNACDVAISAEVSNGR